jgi:hypothetical protein
MINIVGRATHVLVTIILAIFMALLITGRSTGQTIESDGEGEFVLPGGANIQINKFGKCLQITNNSQNTYGYEFSTAAEWSTWINSPPDAGVTYSSCTPPPPPPPPAFCPSQIVSWTVNSQQCVGFLNGINDGQSQVITATAGQSDGITSPNSGSETLQCKNGQLTPSAQVCSSVPASCTDSTGVSHPSGSTFTTTTTSNESCVAAGFGAGATGTASTSTTTTFQCMAGTITQIGSPTISPPNTSQCVNSGGGQCVPFDLANPSDTCAQHNVQNAQQLCEWTAAAQGQIIGRSTNSFAWFAFEFKAHLNWTLSSNLCTCNPSVVTDGQVTPGGAFSTFANPGVDPAPALSSVPPISPVNINPPNCPNSGGPCIVQPQGSCN